MNLHSESRVSSFLVAKLRNSQLLRALYALNLETLNHSLLRSDLFRGSLKIKATDLFLMGWLSLPVVYKQFSGLGSPAILLATRAGLGGNNCIK